MPLQILQGVRQVDVKGFGPFMLVAPAHVIAYITLHSEASAYFYLSPSLHFISMRHQE